MTPSRPEVATPLTDFARLYREHAADVHRFAVCLSGDPPLAEAWCRRHLCWCGPRGNAWS
jgi:hypothetical protein